MSKTHHLVRIENNVVKANITPSVDPGDSVPKAILRTLDKEPDRKIMVDVASGRTWTRSSMSAVIAKAIKIWSKVIGLVKGQVVAFYCPNSDWHAIHLVAVTALGGIVTAGHDDYNFGEFIRVVRDSGASYIIASPKSLDNALKMKSELSGQVRKVLLLDLLHSKDNGKSVASGNSGYDSLLSLIDQVPEHTGRPEAVPIDPFRDGMSISFSSGTTGTPKALLKPHSAILSYSAIREPGYDFIPLSEEHHIVSCHSHFGHMGGLTILLTTLMAGAVACVIDTFTVPKFLQAVNDHGITSLFSVPSYMTQLVRFLQDDDNRSAVSHLNLSSLEDFLIAGEFMPQEISLKLLKLLPSVKRFRQSFGSTELGFAAIVPSDISNESNVLSSGIPSPGFQFKIMPRRDQDQESSSSGGREGMRQAPLPLNQVGEIVAKGPQMADSYLNNPTANLESFDEDGFFYSGDGGFIDERGLLFVSDRFKEIIKFDGIQVSPAELESILLSHAAVQEAAVIGIPHPVHGHIPKAFVVLRDSCAASALPLSESLAPVAAGRGCGGDERLGAGDTETTNTTKRETCSDETRTTTKVTEDQSSHNPQSIGNELMHFVSNRVSSYKQIRGGITVLPTFQRTILGKIDRKFLRSNFSSREEDAAAERQAHQ